MTREEFDDWYERLLLAFPSIAEKMLRSLNAKGTLQFWYDALKGFTLAEAEWCLSQWAAGEMPAPNAYEWDRVHLIARSCIALRRDRMMKSREQQRITEPYRQLPNTPYTESRMASAFKALRPLHQRLQAGELSPDQYAELEHVELEQSGLV